MLQIAKNEYLVETRPDATALFAALNTGRMFTVTFFERTKNEVRTMNCRTGVKRYTTGEGLKFKPLERGLVPVFDVKIKGYRFFNIEGLMSIKVDGITLHFERKMDEVKVRETSNGN